MIFIAFGAWLVGIGVSFYYGNRRLPFTILILGSALAAIHFATSGLGYFYVSGMALLALVIWIANRFDMTM